jgi:hypothetical protein
MPAPRKILPWIIISAALVIIAALIFHFRSVPEGNSGIARTSSLETSTAPTRPVAIQAPSISRTQAQTDVVTTTAPEPQKSATPFVLGSAEAPPSMDPATVVDKMRIVIHNYGSMFNGNPVGSNPEITAELNGGNPKGVRFISDDSGLRINGRGESVDYWGTPFFFHQISGTEMEIRSAGPDRKMWTADDIVTK